MPLLPCPLVREIPLADPPAALRALASQPHAFLLHSAMTQGTAPRSYFGADPFEVFGPERYGEAQALWRRAREPGAADVRPPFTGGLVGAWSYDFGRRLERLPSMARDDLGWPDVWLAAYDVVGVFDHDSGRAWLYSSGLPAAGAERIRRAGRRLDELTRRIERGASPDAAGLASPARAGARPLGLGSTFSPDAYRDAVERVRAHIRRGDIFQANLSQRWRLALDGGLAADPARAARALTHALAEHSPAPFSAFLDLGACAVASASPERFLAVRGGRVETRPIKGTRPRGAGATEDAALRAELLASAKDRAENVMIVDVLRNDLGRVCETGSIAVPELCSLEAFPQVLHLVSAVTGRLRPDRDALDLLHACFPGGSITGAPKIRAMEILEALEPVRRHLYTGSIGWLDWSGDADWSIAIRTAMLGRGTVCFAAGGGITGDSDPEAEYRESLVKAEGLRRALGAIVGEVALEPRGEATAVRP